MVMPFVCIEKAKSSSSFRKIIKEFLIELLKFIFDEIKKEVVRKKKYKIILFFIKIFIGCAYKSPICLRNNYCASFVLNT